MLIRALVTGLLFATAATAGSAPRGKAPAAVSANPAYSKVEYHGDRSWSAAGRLSFPRVSPRASTAPAPLPKKTRPRVWSALLFLIPGI